MKSKKYFLGLVALTALFTATTVNAQLTSSIKVDINGSNGAPSPTQSGFTAIAQASGSSITEQGVTITATGQGATGRNRVGNPTGAPTLDFPDLQRDLVFNGTGSITITLEGLPADTYNLLVVAYDHEFPSPVNVELRIQGAAPIESITLNPNGSGGNNPAGSFTVANNTPDPAIFNFSSVANTTYEIVITGTPTSGRGSRFNGLEISPVGIDAVLTTPEFSKNDISGLVSSAWRANCTIW